MGVGLGRRDCAADLESEITCQDSLQTGRSDGKVGVQVQLFPEGDISPACAVGRLLEALQRKAKPVQWICFGDASFYPSVRWLREFAPLYQERISLPFICRLAVGQVTEEAASLLSGMGCERVIFSLEPLTGDLRNTDPAKDHEMDDIRRSFAIMRQHGIARMSCNLVGTPGETRQQALQMIRLVAEIDPEGAWACQYSAGEGASSPVAPNEDNQFLLRYYWQLVCLYRWGWKREVGTRRHWMASLDRILDSRWLPRRLLVRIHRAFGSRPA